VDVAHHVSKTLVDHFSPRLTMPPVLELMLKAGQLGRKNDHGFYLHNGKRPVPHGELRMFQTGNEAVLLDRAALQERLVLPMVNEAARCLAEGVAESAADIDFAMVMGAGFAPFRGGPLRYADSVGVKEVVARMNRLAELAGERFAPCEWLAKAAGEGSKIYTEENLECSNRKGVVP
jgi:3-hydroxyacyl-CoA dehydrogenase / enoyl-CoA hydratase / 3-hydroxybutyryl-CoA epimerase